MRLLATFALAVTLLACTSGPQGTAGPQGPVGPPRQARRLLAIMDRPFTTPCTLGGGGPLGWTTAKLPFPGVELDEASMYDASTASFTPPQGRWFVYSQAFMTQVAAANEAITLYVYRNGNVHRAGNIARATETGQITTDLTTIIDSTGSDSFGIHVEWHNCSTAGPRTVGANFTRLEVQEL